MASGRIGAKSSDANSRQNWLYVVTTSLSNLRCFDTENDGTRVSRVGRGEASPAI